MTGILFVAKVVGLVVVGLMGLLSLAFTVDDETHDEVDRMFPAYAHETTYIRNVSAFLGIFLTGFAALMLAKVFG